MTDNERIAEWAGAITLDEYRVRPREGLVIGQGRVTSYRFGDEERRPRAERWEPDTDITLWHGPDGLLKEIERRGMMMDFQDAFIDESDPPLSGSGERFNLWAGMEATPAQLTAALVKMIKEAP